MKAEELKILRKKNKLTQKELADAIGTTVSRISEWENKKYEMSNSYQKLMIIFFEKYK